MEWTPSRSESAAVEIVSKMIQLQREGRPAKSRESPGG